MQRVEIVDLLDEPGDLLAVEAVGVLEDVGDGLAVGVGRLLAIAARLGDLGEALVAVDDLGVANEQLAGGCLSLVKVAGVDEIAHGVGGVGEVVGVPVERSALALAERLGSCRLEIGRASCRERV